MHRHRGPRFFGAAALIVAATLGISGCKTVGVSVYSDSILARTDSGSAYQGELTRTTLQQTGDSSVPDPQPPWAWTINADPGNWHAEPGRTMGGGYAVHSYYNLPIPNRPNVVVLSFGTNDADNWAWNTPGSYPIAYGKAFADYWINKAYDAGATCAIWILPNRNLVGDPNIWGPLPGTPLGNPSYKGQTAVIRYTQYMDELRHYLLTKQDADDATPNPARRFRAVDWGTTASLPGGWTRDTVHPSGAGAIWLGQAINTEIRRCA